MEGGRIVMYEGLVELTVTGPIADFAGWEQLIQKMTVEARQLADG
ncbi:hypothetical protein [Frankia sp. AiPs1]|nr:hypothetical protein [Frankia sp. AiPs1]